jgi:hypothetical protein
MSKRDRVSGRRPPVDDPAAQHFRNLDVVVVVAELDATVRIWGLEPG